jgi:hypothetical protein
LNVNAFGGIVPGIVTILALTLGRIFADNIARLARPTTYTILRLSESDVWEFNAWDRNPDFAVFTTLTEDLTRLNELLEFFVNLSGNRITEFLVVFLDVVRYGSTLLSVAGIKSFLEQDIHQQNTHSQNTVIDT